MAYSGVILLGIGDSAASIIGIRYGTIKWPNTNKTVEGTLAFIVSVLFCYWVVCGSVHIPVVLATVLTGLLEGFSTENDNLFIPIYFLSVYQLLDTLGS